MDGTAWLIAVMVTVCCEVLPIGAEYSPEELMLPTPSGAMDQVTRVLGLFVTWAKNCSVCPP
jgi:hypothetical protein